MRTGLLGRSVLCLRLLLRRGLLHLLGRLRVLRLMSQLRTLQRRQVGIIGGTAHATSRRRLLRLRNLLTLLGLPLPVLRLRLLRCLTGMTRRAARATGSTRRSAADAVDATALQRLDALNQRLHRLLRGRQQHPRAQHLEQQPRRRRTGHVRQTPLQHIGEPGQCARRHRRRLLPHRLHAILGSIDQPLLHRIRHRSNDQQITHPAQQILREPLRILPGPDHAVHAPEQCGPIGRSESRHRVVKQRLIRDAQQPRRQVVRHAIRARARQQLIHHRQRITRRPATGAHDQRIHVIGNRNPLLADDALQQPPHQIRRQQTERVMMRARPNGRQHALRLRGRENEDQMLRRLLHDLQQRIEALLGDHVRLIDDEDSVPRIRRRVHRLRAQIAHVLDLVVRRGIQLHHIQVARAARPQRHTRIALPARRRRRTLRAIEAARQNPRRRRLAATARPREQVRMVDPVRGPVRATRFQGRGQGVGHMPLPHDLGKRRRTILPVQSHGPSLPACPDHAPPAFERPGRRIADNNFRTCGGTGSTCESTYRPARMWSPATSGHRCPPHRGRE